MPTIDPASNAAIIEPLAVSFRIASQITGLGQTTLWAYAKQGRIKLVQPPGVRRTLISYPSLRALLVPAAAPVALPRRRGRPRMLADAVPARCNRADEA